jgi:hypothetical protein
MGCLLAAKAMGGRPDKDVNSMKPIPVMFATPSQAASTSAANSTVLHPFLHLTSSFLTPSPLLWVCAALGVAGRTRCSTLPQLPTRALQHLRDAKDGS